MKIVLVDDSKAMRKLIIRGFEDAGMGGHVFVECADGFEAFGVVSNDPPDLVISDWNMSGVSGLDLLRALRSAGNTVPFGFVTAESGETCRNAAFEAGAQFLLRKPFTPEALSEAVAGYVSA